MRALLLAAGLGTRLRPLTNTIPKCMVPILGKPLLEYWLEILFMGSSIDRVLINTHYLPGSVLEYVEASSWKDRIDIVNEPELLGTGRTVKKNSDYFKGEAFMVIHADNLSCFEVDEFILNHKERSCICVMSMMIFDSDQPESCGIVEIDSEGVVVGFHEKVEFPPGSLANGAVYIFEPEMLDMLESMNSPTIDISTEVLPLLLGKINTFLNSQYHRDIGTPESLLKAEQEYRFIE
jgi:mannose-1-phosphate guanylyltransferase